MLFIECEIAQKNAKKGSLSEIFILACCVACTMLCYLESIRSLNMGPIKSLSRSVGIVSGCLMVRRNIFGGYVF